MNYEVTFDDASDSDYQVERREMMKVWCAENCAHGARILRDRALFDDRNDGMMFLLRWK